MKLGRKFHICVTKLPAPLHRVGKKYKPPTKNSIFEIHTKRTNNRKKHKTKVVERNILHKKALRFQPTFHVLSRNKEKRITIVKCISTNG